MTTVRHMKVRFILLTALFALGYPGCNCPDFYLIKGVQGLLFYDPLNMNYTEGGEITADTLIIRLVLDVESYTDAGMFTTGLMSSADAFSFDCATPYANSIASLIFLSNHDFNDIPAGESLNSKVWNVDFDMPVDSAIQFEASEYLFWFVEKPTEAQHTFTAVIVDNAGNEFVYEAKSLTWH